MYTVVASVLPQRSYILVFSLRYCLRIAEGLRT